MKPLVALLAVLALAGCGIDAASSALTAAQLKKQELEQGKKTMTRAEQKIGAAVQQMNDSADDAAKAADDASK